MLDVHRLRMLREVAQRGSIHAAAASLAYTPSAISQQLSKLEKEVSAQLLERTGRGVRLTEMGRIVVDGSWDVFASLDRLEATIDSARGEIHGEVRVGAFASAAIEIVSPAIVRLTETHPNVTVLIEQLEDQDSLVELRLGTLDIAVVQDFTHVTSQPPRGLRRRTLHEDPMVLAVPRSWGIGGVDDIAELADRPWIAEPDANPSARAFLRACRDGGFEPEIRYRTDDFHVMEALVAKGLGAALVTVMSSSGSTDAVQLLPMPGEALVRHVYTATRHVEIARPKVRVVLDEMHRVAGTLAERMQPPG
jgi:DNA-binding transcriptional LysR family regulator